MREREQRVALVLLPEPDLRRDEPCQRDLAGLAEQEAAPEAGRARGERDRRHLVGRPRGEELAEARRAVGGERAAAGG